MSLYFYSLEQAFRVLQFAHPFMKDLNQILWDISEENNQ